MTAAEQVLEPVIVRWHQYPGKYVAGEVTWLIMSGIAFFYI